MNNNRLPFIDQAAQTVHYQEVLEIYSRDLGIKHEKSRATVDGRPYEIKSTS